MFTWFNVFLFLNNQSTLRSLLGCAVLGMAPSASRSKEAIRHLEVALAGRDPVGTCREGGMGFFHRKMAGESLGLMGL